MNIGQRVITDTSLEGTILAGPWEGPDGREFYWVQLKDRHGIGAHFPSTFTSKQLRPA